MFLDSLDPGLVASALGGVVGIVLALTGAGGGILAVPLLVFGLHLPMQQAAPIGLLAVGIAAALGAALGLREGIVRYRAATLIGITGMLLAPFGVWLAQHIPDAPLMVAFAGVLAWTAWRMLRQARRPAGPGSTVEISNPPECRVAEAGGRLAWTLPCARAMALTGALSGTLSGLLGVGGGFVIVPSLTSHTNLDARSILATSLAVIAMVSVGGVSAAALHGAITWHIARPFAAGAVVALLAGRLVAARVDSRHLRLAFAILSLAVAALLLARGLGVVTL
ncbi:sulfite exporter TauE/SafE family protein [Cognatazoarcus halotolerans]|uniref:sulfite exporter TauE/SafE family protein n=1 Tax=Cognatazoarcus halotolerans TaxID=2686016 RepID=UPI00135B3DAC|nr:sulfite exporter TauE/SafE family protein [Cognatazoarcus halotolerans]MBX3680854.1 sulfite exporter TauE/SafE family protein [Rhodocyclaceae bacterium]MCB1901269.1 sulfite exporter TauE/SafE family protein [Rhodocyclaceae bacterium]MCP5308340.1 sulfite exporter TauE/SafE family protein [Zoogloeaceae bacterium]